MTTATDKIAGAPISWGVCEVPGWGYQLSPERVLTEMAQVGLAATEFGPDGFLPADPAVMARFLASRHLTAVGGYKLGNGWQLGARVRLISGNVETPVTGSTYLASTDSYLPIYGATNSVRAQSANILWSA